MFFFSFSIIIYGSEITLVIKRLVKRETINVKFELPGGSRDFDIKTGSNLRGEMIRLDVPVGSTHYPRGTSVVLPLAGHHTAAVGWLG